LAKAATVHDAIAKKVKENLKGKHMSTKKAFIITIENK